MQKRADENANAAELATAQAEMAAKQAQTERDNAHMQLLAMQARRTDAEATSGAPQPHCSAWLAGPA